MKKNPDYLSYGILIVWIVTLALLCAEGLRHTGAQDIPAPYVCRDTSVEWVRFQFHNLPTIDVHDTWGWEADGAGGDGEMWIMDALPDTGTAALFTSLSDFRLEGDANTPPCDAPAEATPEPTAAPVVEQVASQPVVSTGRTCVIKYPQIILVCS